MPYITTTNRKRKNNHKLTLFCIGVILFFLSFYSRQAFAQEESSDFRFSRPVQTFINLRTNIVFVLNRGSSEITFFDAETRNAIFHLPTGGSGSSSMTRGESGNLYVLNTGSGNVTIFPSFIFRENLNQDLINKAIEERKIVPVGETPISLARDTNLQKIYVLNHSDNSISVLDEKTNEIVNTLKLITEVNQVMVDSEINKLYALNNGKNAVVVIDGKTNQPVGTISVGNRPSSMEMGDGRIFVSSYGDDSIYIIDASTDKVTAVIESGGKGPRNLSFNESTKKLYVTHWLDNSITVIDSQSLQILKKINLLDGSHPRLPIINEKTNQIFIANSGIRSVSIIDGEQDEIVSTLETGATPSVPNVNLVTGEVYIPNIESNSITVVSKNMEGQFASVTIPNQKEIVSTGENFSFPLAFAINHEANEIYALNSLASNFVILDSKTYQIKNKVQVGENPREIIFLPNLNKIFVSNADGDSVSIYNVKSKVRKDIPVGDKPINLLFNPLNKKLYVSNINSHNVSVIDTEQEIRIQDIPLDEWPGAIALNQKENKIYLAMRGSGEIVVIDSKLDQISKKINIGPKPTHLLFNETSNRLYVDYSMNSSLTVIDGVTDEIVANLDSDGLSSLLVSDTARKKVYINSIFSGQSAIKSIDSESLTIESPNIPIGSRPIQAIVSPNGKKVFILAERNLDIKDLEKNKTLISIDLFDLATANGLTQTSLREIIFYPEINKLFVALGGADALAVIDTEKNFLEAFITNKGVVRFKAETSAPFSYSKILLLGLITLLIFLGFITWIISGFIVWKKLFKKENKIQ